MKIKISVVLLFIFISTSGCLYSQKSRKPIDYRFRGGENEYISFFSKNIKVPEEAVRNGIFGNLIIKISINPKGEIIEKTTINPVDSIVDNEVLRVIDLSGELWKKNEAINYNQNFYIQVVFSRSEYLPNLYKPKSEVFLNLFPKPILIPLEGDHNIPFTKSRELSEKVNLLLDNGKFEEALPFVNELIKRDPFNRDLYKTRIMINIRLNRPELVEEDDNKMFNFAEGFSLNELFKNQED